jgi:hypothetical protein
METRPGNFLGNFYRPNEILELWGNALYKIDTDKDSSVKLFVLSMKNELNEAISKSIYAMVFSLFYS